MNTMNGLRLKLSIAHDEMEKLKSRIRGVVTNKDLYSIAFESDPNTGEEVHIARVKMPPDAAWGVHIGGIVHYLRSTLDNLAWSLALLSTDTPFRRGAFPVCQTRRQYIGGAIDRVKAGSNKGALRGVLQSISPHHRAMIERTQPYRRGNGGSKDPLWLLSELNNTDKHRVIPVVVMAFRQQTITPVYRQQPFFLGFSIGVKANLPFEDGAELARYPQAVKAKPTYSTSIRFGDGCAAVAGLSVFDTLRSMHKRVSGVVDMFRDEI